MDIILFSSASMASMTDAEDYRIIEPLASRCSKFRFRPLALGSSQKRIEMIASAEGVDAEHGVSSDSLSSFGARLIGSGLIVDTGAREWRFEKGDNVSPNSTAFTCSIESAYTDHCYVK